MDSPEMIIMGISCNDKSFNPPKDAVVGKCQSCNKMCWLSPQAIQAKSDNPDCLIWCSACVKKVQEEEKDGNFHFLELDQIDKVKKTGVGKKGGTTFAKDKEILGILQEEYKEQIENFDRIEQSLFESIVRDTDEREEAFAESMPSIVAIAIARYRIWDNIFDLILAMALRTKIEGVLVERRKKYGKDECFKGYNEDQVMLVLKFLLGVSHAQNARQEELTDIMNDADLERQLHEEFQEGNDYWTENLQEAFDDIIQKHHSTTPETDWFKASDFTFGEDEEEEEGK